MVVTDFNLSRPLWPSYVYCGSIVFRSFHEIKAYIEQSRKTYGIDNLLCPVRMREDELYVHWNNRRGLKLNTHVTKRGIGPFLTVEGWQTFLDVGFPF